MIFECGVSSSSNMLSCYKCCALLEPALLGIKIRGPGLFIRRQGFTFPQSSLKELASCEQVPCEMNEKCPHHSSYSVSVSRAESSIEKRVENKQVQDYQSHQPQNLEGDAYLAGLPEKEIQRRRKIGAANKGKIPWTKGRKWSEEHKKLIKQRTTEALRDPKVRKKMLGHRQLHRQVSKDKISVALRNIWERRIISVESRQKVLQIWSNSIAVAAKKGDHSQDKLDWDSYDRIKSEMISMFLWNKEMERIIKKLKKAVSKIVARKLRAEERRIIEARGTKKSKPVNLLVQKTDAQPTHVVVSTRPKLKERLTKWHGRKKELETVISSRKRKGGSQKPPRWQRTAEWRGEVDLVKKFEIP